MLRTARLLLALACLFGLPARATEVDIDNPRLVASESGGYALYADVHFSLNSRMVDVVSRGVSLYFVADFVLERPRWYWTDEVVAKKRQTWRLSYHALTRQYRLSSGALHESFPTLEDARSRLSRLSAWTVIDAPLPPGERFQARLRFWLDPAQLPKPFQFSVFGGKDWELDSDWRRWTFTVPERPLSEPPLAPTVVAPEPAANAWRMTPFEVDEVEAKREEGAP